MDPKSLFQNALTYPRHEQDDIHYIGEALPAPSLAASLIAPNNVASTGGSAVPAREDHSHDVDMEAFITELNTTIANDPVNNVINLGDDFYTSEEFLTNVNLLIEEGDIIIVGGSGGPGDFAWVYEDEIVDPASAAFGTTWYPPASITITQFYCTALVAASVGKDYNITLWVGGVNEGSFTLVGPNIVEDSGTISVAANALTAVTISIDKDSVFTGDLEGLMVVVRYEYN